MADPSTPRGITIFNGLTEEEQAALTAMRQSEASSTPQSSNPAARFAASKGTKRIFSVTTPATPASPAVETFQAADGIVPASDAAPFPQMPAQGAKRAAQSKPAKRPRASGATDTPVALTPISGGNPISMSDVIDDSTAASAQLAPSFTIASEQPVPSIDASHYMPPPPPAPVRVLLGIPGGPSPPRTLAGNVVSPTVYFFAYNVPPHLAADDIKRIMSLHEGCFGHTLKLRQSKRTPSTNEFVVQFMNRAYADQCAAKLYGKPFVDSHSHIGNAEYKIRTQSDQDASHSDSANHVAGGTTVAAASAMAAASAGGGILHRPTPPRPLPPRGPTRDTFDIGERPSADLPVLVNRRRLMERLQTIIGPSVEVDADVTDFIQDIAHEFITSAVFNGCLLARHRNSTEIDAKDVIPHIERHWGVSCEAHKVDLSKK